MPLVQSPSTQPTTNRTDKVDDHDFHGLEEFEDDDDVEALRGVAQVQMSNFKPFDMLTGQILYSFCVDTNQTSMLKYTMEETQCL